MPQKALSTPYPLIDSDPHFSRVVRYFRPSDYRTIAVCTAAFPTAMWLWEMADPVHKLSNFPMKHFYRQSAFLGLVGGFLMAYQDSSLRFWGWTENKREYDKDLSELRQRAKEGKPLYGELYQTDFVQQASHNNTAFSQLFFHAIPFFNFVNHPHHGTDPAKYQVPTEGNGENNN